MVRRKYYKYPNENLKVKIVGMDLSGIHCQLNIKIVQILNY